VHLAVLWTFAVAKPLFDVLADSPDFFVARGNTRGDILVFSIALVLIPPTALVLLEALATPLPPVRRGLHLLFVAGLTGAFALQVFDDLFDGSSEVLVAGAVVAGVLGAVAYARSRAAPAVLTVLGPAPLVFLLVFLLGSPVSKLVLPQGDVDAAAVEVHSHTPVVLVVFDEFDPNMLMNAEQRIDRTRYPNFAALAHDATWYRDATTVNGSTTMAVPALLSGLRSSPDKLPIASDYPNNLFTLLGGSYSLDVTETATELCPQRLCGARTRDPPGRRLADLTKDLAIVSLHLLAPEGLRSRLPAVDRTFGDFAGGGRDDGGAAAGRDVPASALRNRPGQFEALLRGISRDRGSRALHFVHTALPHIPWEYLPTGQQYLNHGPDSPGLEGEHWDRDPFPARLGLQRHLLQVGYVDRLVGRLMRRLRVAGLYDRALVVVTADHGVSYRAGMSRRGPQAANASDIAAVPLFIKYPRQRRGRIDDSMVETTQIVPTIADVLGARLPWKADGRPIGQPTRESGTVRIGGSHGDGEFRLSFATFVRQRAAGLRRMIGVFGADDGGRRLYANGQGAELLGLPADGLTTGARTGSRVVLDSGNLLDDFHPGARLVPSFVTGRITGHIAAGTPLAVGVNGTVRATTEAFRDGDDVRLAGLVPPFAFRQGSNSIEVYAIGGASGRVLSPLTTERPATYRLIEDRGKTLIAGAGREREVQRGRLEGYIEVVVRDDRGLRVAGWAVDADRLVPVERVVVFSGGQLVAQGRPTLVREDIAAHYHDLSVARSGYEARGSGEGVDLHELRVFALSGNVAVELHRIGK
jgi:PAS domain-containing protein